MVTIQWCRLLVWALCLTELQSFVLKKQTSDERFGVVARGESKTDSAFTKDDTLLVNRIFSRSLLPRPPESTGNPDDDIFRSFRDKVPVTLQNWMRDSGLLRFVVDSLVYVGLPSLVQQYPSVVPTFLRLTSQREKVKYGNHPMQFMDILHPQQGESKGLVVVCHGGAWGSGAPWMYRLTAAKKLECGYTVAIWGYRTYPDATVDGQVSDLRQALAKLEELYPSQHTTLIGHSSGAHVALLGVLQEKIKVDALICVAGVYDIVKHYEFEAGRGVEEISALKPAHGHFEDEWIRRSPTRLVDESASTKLPPTLLVHGVDDSVVPYTSVLEFHDALEQCKSDENCTLSILPSTEHAETVIQLMVGGETQDVVIEWLENQQPA